MLESRASVNLTFDSQKTFHAHTQAWIFTISLRVSCFNINIFNRLLDYVIYMTNVQEEFFSGLMVASKHDIVFVRSVQATRYRLTLRGDGVAVATIPTRGSEREALRFVEKHLDWLDRARARKPLAAKIWTIGTRVLWRGELSEIRAAVEGEKKRVCIAKDIFGVKTIAGDLKKKLEEHFSSLAKIELPARAWELAAETGVGMKMVAVRNQRSRWGSCSTSGTISLNWRLVQTPKSVRDCIIYHELMHLKEMNHSPIFWAHVEKVCPWWRDAEKWLRRNGSLMGL